MKRVFAGIAALAIVGMAAGATQAQDAAKISLLHGIPGVPVDVAVDGSVVVTNLQAGEMQDLTSFAGQTLANVEVRNAGATTIVIGPVAQLAIPGSGNSTFVAHLNDDGVATLSAFGNNLNTNPADQGRLVIRHTADAGGIDFLIGGAVSSPGIQPGASVELQLPVGAVANPQVSIGGGAAITVPPITVAPDTSVIVYVIGSVDDNSIGFLVQTVMVPAGAAATTTNPNATTTTSTTDPNATTTTTTTSPSTTTTTVVPTGVNTGSPLDESQNVTLLAALVAAIAVTGGAVVLRRRTES